MPLHTRRASGHPRLQLFVGEPRMNMNERLGTAFVRCVPAVSIDLTMSEDTRVTVSLVGHHRTGIAWSSRPPSRALKFPVPVWFLCFRSTIAAFTDLRDG